jgi:ethanolamine utilization protein EutQ (cupin superfamily)
MEKKEILKMAKKVYYYNVKNRSSSIVVYSIPEDNIKRRFTPGETKRISYEELLHLSYQTGGMELMANFLQIQSIGVPKSLGIKT